MNDLPVKVVEHIYPESTICPDCGSQMKELDPIVHKYLVYKPAEMYVEEHMDYPTKSSKEYSLTVNHFQTI